MEQEAVSERELEGVEKAPTGIAGLDFLTKGGLPRGRPTLLTGASGAGKTVLAMEILVNGAEEYNEPGVFVSFEENPEDLARNFGSMEIDIGGLVSRGKLALDHVEAGADLHEAGSYELDALLLRVGAVVDSVGARRIAFDGVAALFEWFGDAPAVRRGLLRLLQWTRERGLTCVVTAENNSEIGQRGLGRTLSDCLIMLESHLAENIATRYLRVVKYRGSGHATDRCPFLIGRSGVSVMPLAGIGLGYSVSNERVSAGIQELDEMLGGGYYRGRSVLVSGESGTGKTTVAAHFVAASCSRGERCLYITFEESKGQVLRNMGSIGLDLGRWEEEGLLSFRPVRVSRLGLEAHLVNIMDQVESFAPQAVVLDPLSDMIDIAPFEEAVSMTNRLMDFLKSKGVTVLLTSLSEPAAGRGPSGVGVSSAMDTWLMLRNWEHGGELTRLLTIIKSRGMAHSNRVREFLITSNGVRLLDVHIGPDGVLTGAAGAAREIQERLEEENRSRQIERRKREIENRRRLLEAQIDALREEIRSADEGLAEDIETMRIAEKARTDYEERMRRGPDADGPEKAT